MIHLLLLAHKIEHGLETADELQVPRGSVVAAVVVVAVAVVVVLRVPISDVILPGRLGAVRVGREAKLPGRRRVAAAVAVVVVVDRDAGERCAVWVRWSEPGLSGRRAPVWRQVEEYCVVVQLEGTVQKKILVVGLCHKGAQ